MTETEIDPMMRKEDAPCCNAHRDYLGRQELGFCLPDCLMRKVRDARIKRARGYP
jgi:hypothetical protein